MGFRLTIRRASALAAILLGAALYMTGLTAMGMVGPDEPRYAAVGRAMAATGDWITPRLWGQPWFEKPALLYWMTATGFRLGLGPDLAPRLPVALLSLAFLVFFWWRLRLEWDTLAASYATAILATSAGWLTYSHVAVTDLPLSAFFCAAVLLALPSESGEQPPGWRFTAAAACLGMAVLAKGLVPLVLFLPVPLLGWRRLSLWFRPGPLLAFSFSALPWYIACTLRNGSEFPRVFFLEHHFQRFSSAGLQHVQPWWFYVPVALLLLFPWFPLLWFAGPGLRGPRVRLLVAVVAFGFVFFSLSVNKLPGYILPLMPVVCALMGLGLARTPPKWVIVAPVTLLGSLPLLASVVPQALAHGLRASAIPWQTAPGWIAAAAMTGSVLAFAFRRGAAFPKMAATVLLAATGFLWLEITAFPALDASASARPRWVGGEASCAPPLSRSLLYGLYYYAGRQLPECGVLDPGSSTGVR